MVTNILLSLACVVMAALAAGLTMGMLSLDVSYKYLLLLCMFCVCICIDMVFAYYFGGVCNLFIIFYEVTNTKSYSLTLTYYTPYVYT